MSDDDLVRLSVERAGESVVVSRNGEPFLILERSTAAKLGATLCQVAYFGKDMIEDDASELD